MNEQRTANPHTHGPWTLLYDTRPRMEWNITVVRENDRNYAVCFMTSDGPSEANARLIAAAPDMLEALELLVALPVRYNDKRIEIDTGSHGEAMEIVRKARAAITKATIP